MDGTIVYVVIEGSYSDQGVHSVWDDEGKAKKVEANLGDARVEQRWMNDAEPPLPDGHQIFSVRLTKDGEALNVSSHGNFPEFRTLTENKTVQNWTPSHTFGPYEYKAWYLETWVIARDEEHAKKIAVDRIMQYRAEQEGIA